MLPIDWVSIPLQSSGDGAGAVLLVQLLLIVVTLAGVWKAFEKAGEPGWAAIVPIYNVYVMVKISGNEWWWLLLLFIPLVNIIVIAKISVDIAGRFGQGVGFGLGLWLLGFIFWPLLGFGDYHYRGRDTTSPSHRDQSWS